MRKRLFLLLLWLPHYGMAQTDEVLSYEQAVATALLNNYDIRIAKNNAEILSIENNLGNAGFLPKVDFNAQGSIANNRTNQEFSNGQGVDQDVVSKNISAGVYASYTVFDGFRMFATKERLKILSEQGDLSFKVQIENTLEQLTLSYYQIVKQQQWIKGIESAMRVSDERIKLAEKKLQIGSGSNVELLQAKLDRNAQKSNLILQKSALQEYRNNLMLLMQVEGNKSFIVDSLFNFKPISSLDDIRIKIENENRNVLIAQKNVLVNQQLLKEIKSQTLPQLNITTGYAYGRSQNTAGFSLFNQNTGINGGFVFSWNIFNGSLTKRQTQVANIQLKNSLLNVDRVKSGLFSASAIAYIRWLGDKETLELEEENIKLAEQSLNIMLERMNLGLGNYLEVKESQSSYEAAITRLVNARYNLKESETKLRKMTGKLVE